MLRLIIRPDVAWVLRDRDGHAYNEEGQQIDEQGNLLPEIAKSINRHNLGVARHQENIRADGRRMTLGDSNRPDLFYSNRSTIRPPTFDRSVFEINPAFYTLVSMHPFHGLAQEQPMDHIDRFENLVSSIKARVFLMTIFPANSSHILLMGKHLLGLRSWSLDLWQLGKK